MRAFRIMLGLVSGGVIGLCFYLGFQANDVGWGLAALCWTPPLIMAITDEPLFHL
jgi:hypothetical protein